MDNQVRDTILLSWLSFLLALKITTCVHNTFLYRLRVWLTGWVRWTTIWTICWASSASWCPNSTRYTRETNLGSKKGNISFYIYEFSVRFWFWQLFWLTATDLTNIDEHSWLGLINWSECYLQLVQCVSKQMSLWEKAWSWCLTYKVSVLRRVNVKLCQSLSFVAWWPCCCRWRLGWERPWRGLGTIYWRSTPGPRTRGRTRNDQSTNKLPDSHVMHWTSCHLASLRCSYNFLFN